MQDRYNFNYYKDSCVTKAGGKAGGTIDFYQIHTYSSCQCSSGTWKSSQPMSNKKSSYQLDKPLIIGEFSSVCSARNSPEQMYKHFYEVTVTLKIKSKSLQNDYDGAFGWHLYDEGKGHCSDGKTKTLKGIKSIKGRTDHGQITVNIQKLD